MKNKTNKIKAIGILIFTFAMLWQGLACYKALNNIVKSNNNKIDNAMIALYN